MPWREVSTMSLRQEFVALAWSSAIPFSTLCQRCGISRKTGYKWIGRAESADPDALHDRSRRPLHSPRRTAPELQALIVALRRQHPAWGGRKLAHWLARHGHTDLPAPSTITHILRRHGLIGRDGPAPHPPYRRFEHAQPNDLWQMDFKGDFSTGTGQCHTLTVLDDHSRYNLALKSCSSQNTREVKAHLTECFARYGLPVRFNTDRGQPWGAPREVHGLSQLSVWLVRLGVRIGFSRPNHPQTNGKDERFHRSLKAEVLNGRAFASLVEAQAAFDRWRPIYNHERPHEAIGYAVPAERYQPSPRAFPTALPPIDYGPDDLVAIANSNGEVRFRGAKLRVPKTLAGLPIAFRPHAAKDGHYELYFCHHRFGELDLQSPPRR
jgi:transposase InsO family protein